MITLLKNERGMALAVLTMLIAILASMTGAALLFSRIDLMISGNYRMGTGALYAADAGVGVALNQLPSKAAIDTDIGDYTYRSYRPDEGTDKTAKELVELDCGPKADLIRPPGYSIGAGTGYNPGGEDSLQYRKYDIFIMGTGLLNSAARKIQAQGQFGPVSCS